MADRAILLVVFITTLGITIKGVTGFINLDFRVTPTVVKPLETTNVSFNCLATENVQYNNQQSYYYNQYGQYVPQTNPPPGVPDSIVIIRILKNFQEKWQPIAQISNVAPNTVHKLDDSITSTSGLISHERTQNTFIEVNWDVATSDVFGLYRCDAISFDSQQNAVLTTASQLSLGSTLDALDLLRLLKYETTDILKKVDAQERDIRSNQNLTKQLTADLKELKEKTVSKLNETTQKIKDLSELLKSQGTKQETRINYMEREMSKTMDTIRTYVSIAFDSGFLMLWPRGSYGLLKPKSGCPFGGITNWKSGWKKHHTESTDRNQDLLSTDAHLQEPVLERLNGNNFVTQHFCMKTDANSVGPTWPRGTYCINKKGECPEKFDQGYVTWDEENDDVLQTSEGELPDGVFNDSDVTTIEYCCRRDGPANVTVYLPNSDPFYLYSYGNLCQAVYGMNVTQEYVVFDTENTSNKDKIGRVHPDGTINNLRLELCYYQRS